jgi:hypothetical protein
MEKALQEVREELEDVYNVLSAEDGEEAKDLKKTAGYLLQLLSRSQIEREARKRRELAQAVMEFAEWHKEGYMDDGETRKIISQSLWDRVSENVRDVLQQTPPIPTSG